MDSPTQPTQSPPTVKIDEHVVEAPHVEARHTIALEPGEASKPRDTRANMLQAGAAIAIALVLVALAVWWLLRQPDVDENSPTPQRALPENVVGLINSSTPVTLHVQDRIVDRVSEPDDPPESEGWSQAVRQAHRALEEGRYSSAISQYSALVVSSNRSEALDALWGLAAAYAASGQHDLAIRSYSVFAELDDPRARGPRAATRIGQIYERQGRNAEAARAYEEYLGHAADPVRHAVMLAQARLSSDTTEAERIYTSVIDGEPNEIDLRQALTGLAELKTRQGKHAEAAELYDDLAALREGNPRPVLDNEGIPAQVLAAWEALLAPDPAEARRRLLDYVKKDSGYPYGRHVALNALVQLDSKAVVSGTVSPMLAAEIAYAAGYYSRAIEYLDVLRATSSNEGERARAALMTGRAFELAGNPAAAYNWYTATVQTYPDMPQAPEAIRRAGDALAKQAAWDAALAVYREATERYPAVVEENALARVNGGVLAYRLEKRALALHWLLPVVGAKGVSDTTRAQAAFWAGKVQKNLGQPEWRDTLGLVSRRAPGTYLDFRARALLAGEPDGGPLSPTFSQSDIEVSDLGVQYDKEADERRELLDWAATLAVTSTKPITNSVLSPSGSLSQAARRAPASSALEFQRAAGLLKLGFDREAYRSFRALAERLYVEGDAEGLAQLVLYVRYHADTRTGQRVAERLAMLDRQGDPLKRPRLLLKTLYPTPYGDLVVAETEEQDMDPLVMYALMRQESQFVPDARSHANARGLTQVIPSTGEYIAEKLNDTGYSLERLYLPHVSVRYGTYYLSSTLTQFGRRLLPALAGYNGGPGNAARWLQGSALLDPDLFIERIDLFETEDYLEKVYQNYGFYKEAYRW